MKEKRKKRTHQETFSPNENEDQVYTSEKKRKQKHIPSEASEPPTVKDTKTATSNEPEKRLNEIISSQRFDTLTEIICEKTLKAISEMGFETLTQIQARTLPHLLEGNDVIAKAKTGSGKTLAFLIPTIERIHKMGFQPKKGTAILIISPTRELSIQTFETLKKLIKYHPFTIGLVIGGSNRKSEVKMLSEGVNILVATPGRLIDHLQNTPQFKHKYLKCLVIDEADRLLDIGFEDELRVIIKLISDKRQTLLFSATMSNRVKDMAQLALKDEPIFITTGDDNDQATVSGLEQGYMVVSSEHRLRALVTMIKKNLDKKVMIFFSSCMSVKFHYELFNFIDLPVKCIHGKQKQNVRTTTFFEFCNVKHGVLLCTDVAARGWDIPEVDLIIQYDPPDDPKEYIHRVGRTARGEGSVGKALLFLRVEELSFLKLLTAEKIVLTEYEVNIEKLCKIQAPLENLVQENYEFKQSAKEAFKGYVRSYYAHRLREAFDIGSLDLKLGAKSFGFLEPPHVELNLGISKQDRPRKKIAKQYSNNQVSNSKNTDLPRKFKPATKDTRQFSR